MFAVVSLRQLAEIEDKVYGNKDFSGECITLADEVDAAIRRYGTFNHPVCGRIYALRSTVLVTRFVWTMPMYPVCWLRLIWVIVLLKMRFIRIPVK